MKHAVGTIVALMSSTLVMRAQEVADSAPANSTVTAVTVYSDRARVTRKAAVELKAGAQTLEFGRLPGWIDENSIRLSVHPPDAGRIADVRVSREFLARAGDRQVREASAAVQEIADQVAALDDELKVLSQQAKHVEDVKVFSMDKLPRDMASRDVSIETYGKVVEFVSESLRRNAAARRDIEKKKRDLAPEQQARARKLNELHGLVQLQQTLVRVTVDCQAARKADISLTYMLPGATWEPVHELRAQGRTPSKVDLASYAVVTQTTGEDWTGAELAFSSQSSDATIRIPELTSLLLNNKTVSRLDNAGPNTYAIALDNYAGQNRMWYAYNNPGDSVADFGKNVHLQQAMQNKTTAVFQKLQNRGTTAHFQATVRPVIRGDGRPVRVPIGDAVLPSVHRIVAAPEASLNAANVLQLTNTCSQPLLPGRIALYHEGAFLGMTDMDFVASAESFPVFLGVADQVKLSRVLDRQRSSLVRGRRTRMQVSFDGSIENLSADPARVMLTDRIPVSEDKEIRVSGVSTEPDVDPDSNGIVTWDVSLKPGQRFVYRLHYTIEYPPEELERLRKAKQELNVNPSSTRDLDYQIRSLESKF